METIFKRRSIRAYLNTPVSETEITSLLRAGMAAPSSSNNQEWEFVVIQNPDTFREIMEIDPWAKALKSAPLCIAVCANMNHVSEPEELFWVQDLSAAAQNMLLEATHLGLGSLWMGLYPSQRSDLQKLLKLPHHIDPLILLAFGKADETRPPNNRFLSERIHFEQYEHS